MRRTTRSWPKILAEHACRVFVLALVGISFCTRRENGADFQPLHPLRSVAIVFLYLLSDQLRALFYWVGASRPMSITLAIFRIVLITFKNFYVALCIPSWKGHAPKTYKKRGVCSPVFIRTTPSAIRISKMFPKLSLVATSVLAMAIAAAATTVVPPSQPVNSLQCCNAFLPNTAPAVIAIAGLLGLDVSGLNVRFGVICKPLFDFTGCDTFIRCATPDVGWGGLIAVNCPNV
ncbi:hypothetical protein C8J57DRAFT_1373441 [Mycena rebaudengoi]|nr:hypothetical protein C8J57DRAFT_1373441 [Mycena rebaudengoi]